MATAPRQFRIPAVILERIDAVRGEESRTAVILRAVEFWLAERSADDAFDVKTVELREQAAEGRGEWAGVPVPNPPREPLGLRPSDRRRFVSSADAKAGVKPI